MTTLAARRLLLPLGEVAELCARLGVLLPPGFTGVPTSIRSEGLLDDDGVHPSVAAGLIATCAPQVAVLVRSSLGDLAAAYGIRADLGGSMLRAGDSDVEVSAWPALRLGAELARGMPQLGMSSLPRLHLPLAEISEHADLRAAVIGILRVNVVAPPDVIGPVVWLATAAGWLALEPADVHRGVRWATVRPVGPDDLGAAVAPLVAAALA
jgi:hypothetical protein